MKFSSVCAAVALCLAGAAQAQVVNIDTQWPGSNTLFVPAPAICASCTFVGTELNFGSGMFTVTPVDTLFSGATFTAANRFGTADAGWEWALWLQVGAGPVVKYGFGGGLTTNAPGYQASAADAFAAAQNLAPITFSVITAGTPVKFMWLDDQLSDNTVRSGISVNVTAVPEPGTYAMLLAGLAAVGFMAKRRSA